MLRESEMEMFDLMHNEESIVEVFSTQSMCINFYVLLINQKRSLMKAQGSEKIIEKAACTRM